jgi:hypothetical protein
LQEETLISKKIEKRIAIAFCNEEVVMKYTVSGAIAIPKASWGCAPALPNRIKFPKNHQSMKSPFFPFFLQSH